MLINQILLGLKNVFEGLTSPEHELLIFASGWGMKSTMGAYYSQWHAKLGKNGVKGRALLSVKMKSVEKFPYRIRYLREEFVLPATTVVYGDKVIIVVWSGEPLAVVIHSKEVAESYSAYFELLWKIAES